MTLWEFNHAMVGYARAHAVESKPEPPTDARHAELLAKHA